MSLGNYFSYKYHQIVENGEFLITHIPSTLISSLIIPLYFPTFLHTQPFTYTFNNYYSSTQQKLRMSVLGSASGAASTFIAREVSISFLEKRNQSSERLNN